MQWAPLKSYQVYVLFLHPESHLSIETIRLYMEGIELGKDEKDKTGSKCNKEIDTEDRIGTLRRTVRTKRLGRCIE